MKEESKAPIMGEQEPQHKQQKHNQMQPAAQKSYQPKPPEVYKTAYEKFEDNMREIIFNILYVLLKNEEHTKGDTTIEVVLDMIQIYSFTFNSSANFPWKQDGIMYYLQWVFNIVQVDTLFNYIDYTTFLVIFYVSIMLVILVILDIFYVSYSFQQKKFKYVWPLKLLRSVCGLMVTVFFLNFLELFCNFLKCLPDENDPNKLMMNLYPEVECYSGLFTLHMSFAVAVSFVFVIICLIAALALFETKESPNDVCAKVTSRPDFAVLVVKLVLLYQFSFLYQPENHWLMISTTFIMSLIIYKGYRDNWPYYLDYMNRLMSLVTGLFLWGNFVLIIVKILDGTQFDGGLQIYLLGLPLVGLMIVFGKDERVELLNRNINNFQRGEDMALQIRYFLNLVQTRETNRRNAIILRGYIFHHEDSCSYSECCLAQYKALMKQKISEKNLSGSSGTNKEGKNTEKRSHKGEMQKLLLQHAKNMYKAAMRKFPSCTPLRIQYSFFLLDHMKRKQEAMAELNLANSFSPSFEEKFIIFRYLKMSEDYDDVGDSNVNGAAGGGAGEEMDVVAKFAYESSMRQFQENIMQSAQHHAEFWNSLKSDRPDMSLLNDCGSQINKSVVLVEQFWEQLQKLSPNQPQVMKTYARYLSQVLNDTQRGQELMARAKEATSGGGANGKNNYLDVDGLDIQNLGRFAQPCIMVSGNLSDVGIITQLNQGACRVFGYTQNELIGQNVEKLMPPIYAKHHSKILRTALQRGPEHIPTKERFVFAMHKSGYIFPVNLQLKLIQSGGGGAATGTGEEEEEDELQDGHFIAILKIDKKLMSSNIGFLLIDKDKRIQAISSSCITMLYMDISRLKKINSSGITIDSFASDIFSTIPQLPNADAAAFETQSYPIQWNFASELERQHSQVSKQKSVTSSDNNTKPLDSSFTKGKPLNIPKPLDSKGDFMCSVRPLEMGEFGEVAQCVRLDFVEILYHDSPTNRIAVVKEDQDTKNGQQAKKQSHKKLQQQQTIPSFQFKFEGKKAKFVRDVARPGQIEDMGTKNEEFLRWQTRGAFSSTYMFNSSMASSTIEEEDKDMVSSDDIILQANKQGAGDGSGENTDRRSELDQSLDLSQRAPLIETPPKGAPKKKPGFSEIQHLMQRKREWGRGISIYQLQNGLFQPKVSEDEMKRLNELEDMKKRQLEDLEEEQAMMGFDQVGGNLNSKKALQNALKDRRPISSITRLKVVMNVAMISLIILAAADYSVIGSAFREINENFNLIKKSYGRISEVQRVAFDIRALIMINEGLLDPTKAKYISDQNASRTFPVFLKEDIKQALAQLYEFQSSLSLSPLSISADQHHLLYDKSVPLYFADTQGKTVKTLKFTLNEAFLQILSAIFTAKHLEYKNFTEGNEDLKFINNNIYKDLMIAMRKTSKYYVEDLLSRADGEYNTIIALFLVSAFTLAITLIILFPVVRSVSTARLKILSLFVDIPYSIAINLSAKCERFIAANQETKMGEGGQEKTEVNTEDLDAGSGNNDNGGVGGNEGHGESDQSESQRKRNTRARIPIFESAMKDNSFFIQFGFAKVVLLSYFIAMLVISLQYTSRIKLLTTELNMLAQTENYYAFAQNLQRELVYRGKDSDFTVLDDQTLFKTATDSLERLFDFNTLLLNKQFEHRSDLPEEYLSEFTNFYRENLCGQSSILKQDLMPFECKDYGYALMGLQATVTRYFELLKDTLKAYANLELQGMNATMIASTLANSKEMAELYVLQYRLIGDSMRHLVSKLTTLTNEYFQSTLDIKVIAFVIFIVALSIAYLALWLPFAIKLSKDMWRSKSMLSIIPIEVILRMPRINQFLLKQSFSEIKVTKQDAPYKARKGRGDEDEDD